MIEVRLLLPCLCITDVQDEEFGQAVPLPCFSGFPILRVPSSSSPGGCVAVQSRRDRLLPTVPLWRWVLSVGSIITRSAGVSYSLPEQVR